VGALPLLSWGSMGRSVARKGEEEGSGVGLRWGVGMDAERMHSRKSNEKEVKSE